MPLETFRSLKFVCYGLSAFIFEYIIKFDKEVSLSKFNQDICENHSANVRNEASGSHQHPTQQGCMSSCANSSVQRLQWIKGSNCSMINEHNTVLSVKEVRRSKRTRSNVFLSKKKRKCL